jgi:hypothetical protein
MNFSICVILDLYVGMNGKQGFTSIVYMRH